MKKDTKIIISTIILMILMGSYKLLINKFAPNFDQHNAVMIRKLLQAITIIIYITLLKMWKDIGSLTLISKKEIIILLPVIVLSFIPIFSGINPKLFDKIFIILIISILIGIIEELVFRGIIFSALKSKGKIPAILFSSIIFSLFHLLNLATGADILETLVQILFAFGFGLVMAVAKYKSNSLLALIAVHALWDFIISISNTDFPVIIDIIHSISLVLVVLWGIFLAYKTIKQEDQVCE